MKSETLQKYFPLFHPRLTKNTEIGYERSRQSQLTFLCSNVLTQNVSVHIKRAFLRLTKYHRKVVIYIAFKYCTMSLYVVEI
jgi:hypothetical protein